MKQGGDSSNTLLSFIPSDRRKFHLFIIFFTIAVQLSSTALLFFDVPISKILLILFAFPLLFFLLSSVKNFFIFIIIYSTCIPLHSYTKIFRGFLPISIKTAHLYALFTMLIIYWAFSIILKNRKIKIGLLGYSIIIYICITAFSFFHGFINGYVKNIRFLLSSGILPQLLYLSFFIFMTTSLKEKNKRLFFDFILFASVFIGLQLIYVFFQNRISVFTRIPTVNVHIALFIFPYVLGILLLTKSLKRKIVSVVAILPILFAVLISLQRALWLAIAIVFIISLFLYLFHKGYSLFKTTFVSLSVLLIFSLLFLVAIFTLSKVTSGAAILVLLKRFLSFADINYLKVDPSVSQRLYEIKTAISKINGIEWFIGKGIGDTITGRGISYVTMNYIDNSYAWVVWKMGIIGLLSFLTIFGFFFQRSIFLLRKCTDNEDMIYVITIFLNILGLMIVALTNSCLVHYRFIIIWAISMAIMESIYRKYRNENSINLLK